MAELTYKYDHNFCNLNLEKLVLIRFYVEKTDLQLGGLKIYIPKKSNTF